MNFSVNDELCDEYFMSNIFEHIHEKLEFNFGDFTFLRNGEEYFKTNVSNETYFKEDIKATVILKEGKAIFTLNEDTKYNCRALLQIPEANLGLLQHPRWSALS